MNVILTYQDFEYFKHYCQINHINIVKVDFKQLVCCNIELPFNEKDKLMYETNKKQFNIQEIQVVKEKNIKKMQ